MQTRIKQLFDSIFFTFIALTLGVFQLFDFSSNEKDYITIGIGIIAFIGILPALSIIAIQNASEKWSPKIAEFYKNDSTLKWTSRLIGTIGLIFLSLGISSNIDFSKTFPLLGLCGVSLDCLMSYYHKVCDLLDPSTACETVGVKAEKIINAFQYKAQEYAKKDIEKEKEFYHGDRFEVFEEEVRIFTNELSTAGYKAAINYESNTAEAALKNLVKIAQCYARNREYNFTPEPYLRNYDLVVNSMCEGINNIFNAALRNQDKKSISMIFKTYQEVIVSFLLISFRATLEKYDNKDGLGEQQKEIFIIGLDGLYRCKEAVLGKFERDINEINSTFVPLFYLSFYKAAESTADMLVNLERFCFYIAIIRKFYSHFSLGNLESELNYYWMIASYLGSIPSVEINKETISKSDKKAISVILDADDWLKLLREANRFFNRPYGPSCIYPIKIIK
ncbi:MAG: hypothetical protein K2W94_08470 [Alphaproteobacteria bacterium]|nr:hypothetical protein [Alphaproteobacteria bacterium]